MICCLLAVCSCDGIRALPTPDNVEVDEATLVLNWKAVKGARMYTVSIEFENGEVKEIISSKNSYSLSSLGAGKYNVRVMANGKDGESRDSAWSDPKEFIRDPEPGMAFTLINGGTEYEVSSKGIATGDIVIPEKYRGKPVTSIGKKAFFNKSDVDTVTLHDGIKSIGEFAFSGCSYLTAVNMPAGLTHISPNAFSGCRALASEIIIPEGVVEIPSSAFAYCSSIPRVVIGDNVEIIGANAFSDCVSITEIVIPDKVRVIGDNAFSSCSLVASLTVGASVEEIGVSALEGMPLLEEVTLPNSLRTIGERAFFKCTSLATVNIGDKIESIDLKAFAETKIWELSSTNEVYVGKWFLGLKDTSAAALSVADGTVGIANYALSSNRSISNVILPDSVKRIGACAFAASEMNYVVIGAGVEIIDQQAFENCFNLSRIILGSYDPDYGTLVASNLVSIGSYVFRGCKSLEDITIPDTVRSIGSYAFRGSAIYERSYTGVVYADNWLVDYNENLYSDVIVDDSTVGIANYAFNECKSLISIVLPSSVKIIGRAAFFKCVNLREITLPETLEVIDDYTFYYCNALKITTLPPMLKSIGRSAFYKCGTVFYDTDVDTDNDTLLIPSSVEYIGDYAFYGCGKKTAASMEVENAKPDVNGIDIIIIGDGVKTIGAHAFHGFASLREIVFGDSLTDIGERAFYQCESLESVSFGASLRTVGSRAFYKCTALKSVILPGTVELIGDYAFYKCISITELELGGARSIGKYAFSGCGMIERLVLPDTLESIGRQAFRGAASLTSVILPESVTDIDKHAFYGCTSLTVYAEPKTAPETWVKYWNSSYRPVIWGCTLSSDTSYVVSFTKAEGSISYKNESNSLSMPLRYGYVFDGWSTVKDATRAEYTADNVTEVADGTVLYSVWSRADEA